LNYLGMGRPRHRGTAPGYSGTFTTYGPEPRHGADEGPGAQRGAQRRPAQRATAIGHGPARLPAR